MKKIMSLALTAALSTFLLNAVPYQQLADEKAMLKQNIKLHEALLKTENERLLSPKITPAERTQSIKIIQALMPTITQMQEKMKKISFEMRALDKAAGIEEDPYITDILRRIDERE